MTTPTRKQVRAARLARGWSQYRLAVEAGVHPQTVSIIERGAVVLPETLAKITAALELPIESRQAR